MLSDLILTVDHSYIPTTCAVQATYSLSHVLSMLLVVHLRSNHCHPRHSVDEIEQPRQIEMDKLPHISFSNTCPHPNTMMVVALDANVAIRTVLAVGRLIHAITQRWTEIEWGEFHSPVSHHFCTHAFYLLAKITPSPFGKIRNRLGWMRSCRHNTRISEGHREEIASSQ